MRSGDVRVGRLGLGARLADVFNASAGLDQAKLRRRLVAIGAGSPDRDFDIAAVDSRNRVSRSDALAFVDQQLGDAAAYFGCDSHLGCLDVTRRTRRRRRRAIAGSHTSGEEQRGE